MSDLSTLKEEILEWANKPGSMKKFTTHDVYDAIHSAETPSKTSDTLRGMWKYDKTLDREEFMDGNKKRFVYSLNKKVDMQPVSWSEPLPIPKKLNKIGAIPELSGISKGTADIVNKEIASPAYVSGATAGKGIANTNNNQQIEIPNNFSIELKTPSGFVITIKSSDLKENK